MACRLPFLLAVLVLAPLDGVSVEARADIGFAQAASTAQIFNPGRTLVSMRRRVRNTGVLEYNTGFIDPACVSVYGTDLNGTTGFVIGTATEALVFPEDVAMQDVMQRLSQVQLSFTQALATLRQHTGRADGSVERIDLASELFMIFYVVQYTDTTRYIIDAITGEVTPAIDLATSANSISPAAYWQRIQRAYELSGADSGWYVIFGATGHTSQGVPVGITLINPANGRLKQVEMLGNQHQALEFSPIGHLLQVTSGLRGIVAYTQVSVGQFLARIQSDFPGGKVADIGLQAQVNNTGTVVTWNATILTAAGQSVVFSVNAMTAAGSGSSPHPDRAGDYNCDNHVTGEDLADLLIHYNLENCDLDLDQDGWVKGEDLSILLSNWG